MPQAERWSMPAADSHAGDALADFLRATFRAAGFAPWPITSSIAFALRTSSGLKP